MRIDHAVRPDPAFVSSDPKRLIATFTPSVLYHRARRTGPRPTDFQPACRRVLRSGKLVHYGVPAESFYRRCPAPECSVDDSSAGNSSGSSTAGGGGAAAATVATSAPAARRISSSSSSSSSGGNSSGSSSAAGGGAAAATVATSAVATAAAGGPRRSKTGEEREANRGYWADRHADWIRYLNESSNSSGSSSSSSSSTQPPP